MEDLVAVTFSDNLVRILRAFLNFLRNIVEKGVARGLEGGNTAAPMDSAGG